MNRFSWILLVGLALWIGFIAGQHMTIHRFNNEIERLSTENAAILSQKRNLRAYLGRLEAEVTILKKKIGRK